MANGNTPTETAQPFTKTELLATLRALESRVYSSEAVGAVKKLPQEQIQSFVAARLHLTAVIAELNASLMRDLRERLESVTADLRQGIDRLSASLDRLTEASAWAESINSVLGVLAKVIPLL